MSSRWHGVEDPPVGLRGPAAPLSERPSRVLQIYFLTSERLGFRCWNSRDESRAIDLWCNQQVTALIGGPWSREAALDRLSQEIDQQRQYRVAYWPVFLRADGRFAGCAGLRPYESGKAIYEMGVHLLPEFWGQGLAREACEAIVSHAFGRLGISAIFAGHHPRNAASGRLLMKLGFTYQGDQRYIPTGLMHPTYLLRKN